MDCGCNCFGIASSSRFPVKRYNLLVPDIFPKKQPEVSERVDASTERKYKKLYEYIDKNPHRGPKASRRLARRAHKELHSRNYGYVQVAAQAYTYLLQRLPPQDSTLFARELLAQNVDREKGRLTEDPSRARESVVGALLQNQNLEARIWGGQAFAAYVHTQGSLDFAPQLQLLMHLLLPSIQLSGVSLTGATGAAPSKGDLVRLQVAALQALREFIVYSGRVYASKESRREAAECVMDLLQQQTAPGGPLPCSQMAAEDTPLGEQQGKQQPVQAALSCMDALFDLCQDAVEGREIINLVLTFMDRRQVWKAQPDAYAAAIRRLQQVSRREGQDSLVFSLLLRHMRGLPQGTPQQALLLREACRQAASLPAPFAIPALTSALQELPHAMPAASTQAASPATPVSQTDPGGAREQSMALISGLAARVGSSGFVLEVLGGVCTRPAQGDGARSNAMACFQAALQGSSSGARAPGLSFPQALTEFVVSGMASSEPPQRTSAHLLGSAALQQVDGQLPDSQSALLLTAAWREAASAGATPASLASLDTLLESLLRVAGLHARMQTLQWALSLRQNILSQADGGHFRSTGHAQQLVLLYAYNALLLRLSAALGSRRLPELLLHLVAAECPQLRLTNHGLDAAPPDLEFGRSDEAAAAKVLQRLRSEEAAGGSTAARAASAVRDSPALRRHPQALAMLEQLQQPFNAAAGSPATERGSQADQAQLVKRLEALFPASRAPHAKAPAAAPAPPQALNEQQSEDLAMSDANGAAMANLLSALDSAMLNGGDPVSGSIDGKTLAVTPSLRRRQSDVIPAVQQNGLQAGAAS